MKEEAHCFLIPLSLAFKDEECPENLPVSEDDELQASATDFEIEIK